MEVSWYLRFARTDKVEIAASRDSEGSVHHAMTMHPDWTIASEDREDHLLFTFERREPVYSKKETDE